MRNGTSNEGNEPAPITIGITGHRSERLDSIDPAILATRIDAVQAAIEAAAPGCAFRLIGSLATGADQISVDVALARGWQIDTILPFPREIYTTDFEAGQTLTLERHLAASVNIFELPGSRMEAGGSAAAYERAGRVVLAQSDLLLAIWDGDPVRGRGGTAQIVAEAINSAIPVLVIDPDGRPPELLWQGLNAHELGPESIETVARGTLDDLPLLLKRLNAAGCAEPIRRRRWSGPRAYALAYPILLAITGVRRLRLGDFKTPVPAARPVTSHPAGSIDFRIDRVLILRFDVADCAAAQAAQAFRGAFVSNFACAAFAVTLSLLGLVIPAHLKPLLVLGEFAAIASILTITHRASRAGWHQRWLDQRQRAEHLRCLALSARLGDLLLRGPGGERAPDGARETARAIALPSLRVNDAYLEETKARLIDLLNEQVRYLERETLRMARLEHRLHRLGGFLFALTALLCLVVLIIEGLGALLPDRMGPIAHRLPIGITVISASLPAIGAAIYGIRMQGDFAGVVERNQILSESLGHIRRIAIDDVPSFDTLRRLIARAAELLTADVSQWMRASKARPLTLPG